MVTPIAYDRINQKQKTLLILDDWQRFLCDIADKKDGGERAIAWLNISTTVYRPKTIRFSSSISSAIER